MHFHILKENLQKALSIVGRNISSRAQLPILSNILIKTTDNYLTMASTNLEIGIIYTINAKIEKEGEVTVPGKLLTEFISSLSAEKIEFLLDGSTLKVSTNKTHASFATIASTDFPTFPKITAKGYTFPVKKLKEVISRIVFAASTDEGRPVLTGVKTILKDGAMTLSATDGYRLSIEKLLFQSKQNEMNLLIPASTLTEIVRIIQDTKAEEIDFSIIENKNQAVFSLPQINLYTRLIDGEFPNVEKIIPASYKTKVIIDRDQFAQSVKTASLFARGAANIIKIKVEKDRLCLTANTPQIGDDEDFVEANVVGEESEIAFNFRFLLDLLANFPNEKVIMEISGALNPGVFRSDDSISFLHLIMPVRVQT